MEMYSTMNFCASGTSFFSLISILPIFTKLLIFGTGGMDACDKVSQLMKCGKENSPELLTGVMNNLENMIKVLVFY